MKTICPHCNQEFPETPDEYLGMTLECPSCHQNFVCEKPRFCTECGTFNHAAAMRCRQCGEVFSSASPITFDTHASIDSSGDFGPGQTTDSADNLSFWDKLVLKFTQWRVFFLSMWRRPRPVRPRASSSISENASSALAEHEDKDCFLEEVDLFTAWRKFADFRGRSSRSEFALHIVTIFVLHYFLAIEFPPLQRPITVGTFFLVQVPLFVRRLHDIGLSGWWSFLAFPVNCIFCGLPAVIVSSQPGKNRWGLNPVGVSSHPERNKSRSNKDGLTVILVLTGLICLGVYIGLNEEELDRKINMLKSTNAYCYQSQILRMLESLDLSIDQKHKQTNDNITQVNNNIKQTNDNITQVNNNIKQTNDNIKRVNNNIWMLTSPDAYEYRWEYFDRDKYKSFASDLSTLASNGWEYVGVLTNDGINSRFVLFRRKRNR